MQEKQSTKLTYYGGTSQAELFRVLQEEDRAPRVNGAVYEHRIACAR